jgi:DNA-binding CsgD family transcriptional regulator
MALAGFPKPEFRKHKTNVPDPKMVERDMQIWEARLRGVPPRQIAQELQIDIQTVSNAVKRAAKMIALDTAEDMVKMEVERIDILIMNCVEILEAKHYATSHGKVVLDPTTGDPLIDSAPSLKAINEMANLMKRRAELLGLDAPKRTENAVTLTQTDAQDLELMDMINSVKAQMALGLEKLSLKKTEATEDSPDNG